MARFAGKNVTVVGGTGRLGRELVAGAHAEGAQVLAIARNEGNLAGLAREFGGLQTLSLDVAADDAADIALAASRPDVLVVCGGARPTMLPFQAQSWERCSNNWNVDVKASFAFCAAALRKPLAPGSVVVLISSGAGLAGSQLSGGYAGAKRTQMFVAEYAQAESERLHLGIRFLAIVPRYIMPTTEMGRAAVAAYRARETLNQKLSADGADSLTSVRDEGERRLLERYVRTRGARDRDAFVALLREDAILTMPPVREWYRGRAAIRELLAWAWEATGYEGYRFVPIGANCQPAFALYGRDGESAPWEAHALHVVTLGHDGVTVLANFLDSALFARFGLPLTSRAVRPQRQYKPSKTKSAR